MSDTTTRPITAELSRRQKTIRRDTTALFDRIINLKFTRKSGRTFSIRSDYEPVYGRDGSAHFKRCLQKPQIKLTYEQVPGDAVIQCDIEVTNLFIDPNLDGMVQTDSSLGETEKATIATKEGEATLLEENGDPVREITVQAGYIGQFPDWTKNGMADDRESLRRFYELDNNVFTNDPQAGAVVELRLQALTTQAKGLPPDRVTLFQCVSGQLYHGLVWEREDSDLLSGYGDITFPTLDMTPVEKMFFVLVTRRFVNPALRYYREDNALMVTAPFVDRVGETLYAGASKRNPVKVPVAPDGCLSLEDAKAVGVHCWASQALRASISGVADTFIGGLVTDGALSNVAVAPFVRQQQLLQGQLRAIQQAYPQIRWRVLNNGDFFCYHAEESAKTLFGDKEIQERQRNTITLPAIYDMTVDGLRQVRAPFYGFINPYSTVRVNARYNLGTLVGFYYPKQRRAYLVVITQKAEFSTTGDENLMELSCVDLDPGDVVEYDPETGRATISRTALAEAGTKRESRFAFKVQDRPVFRADGSHSRLEYIAQLMVESANSLGMKAAWKASGKTPTIPLAIQVLLNRNKDLLDVQARKDRGNAPEYYTHKQELNKLGITFVPYLYEDFEGKQDVIKYRIPWEPDDDGSRGDVMEELEQ